MVAGILERKPAGGRAIERMSDVQRPIDGKAPEQETLQLILLSTGDGSEPCGEKV